MFYSVLPGRFLQLNTLKPALMAIAFVGCILPQFTYATDSKNTSPQNQLPSLVQDIKSASKYSWGMVGTPSDYTIPEKAIRILYQRLSAEEIYEIASNASIEGTMYLLCALRRKQSPLYQQLKSQIEIETTTVVVFTGSVLSRIAASSIISQIEKFNCDPLNYQIN